jgi:hypothetical protein
MDVTPIVYSVIAMIVCLVSLDFILNGWLMFSKGKPHLFAPQQMSYLLMKLILGEEDANRRRELLFTPEKVKRFGVYTILGGCLSLIGGLLMLIDALIKINNMR